MCSVECQPSELVWDFQNHFFLDTSVNRTTNTDKGASWNFESLCLHHFFVVVCVCVCVKWIPQHLLIYM